MLTSLVIPKDLLAAQTLEASKASYSTAMLTLNLRYGTSVKPEIKINMSVHISEWTACSLCLRYSWKPLWKI